MTNCCTIDQVMDQLFFRVIRNKVLRDKIFGYFKTDRENLIYWDNVLLNASKLMKMNLFHLMVDKFESDRFFQLSYSDLCQFMKKNNDYQLYRRLYDKIPMFFKSCELEYKPLVHEKLVNGKPETINPNTYLIDHSCLAGDSSKIIEFLIGNGYKYTVNSLRNSLKSGNIDLIKLFYPKFKQAFKRNILLDCLPIIITKGHLNVLKYLNEQLKVIPSLIDQPLLYLAVKQNHFEMVKYLIENRIGNFETPFKKSKKQSYSFKEERVIKKYKPSNQLDINMKDIEEKPREPKEWLKVDKHKKLLIDLSLQFNDCKIFRYFLELENWFDIRLLNNRSIVFLLKSNNVNALNILHEKSSDFIKSNKRLILTITTNKKKQNQSTTSILRFLFEHFPFKKINFLTLKSIFLNGDVWLTKKVLENKLYRFNSNTPFTPNKFLNAITSSGSVECTKLFLESYLGNPVSSVSNKSIENSSNAIQNYIDFLLLFRQFKVPIKGISDNIIDSRHYKTLINNQNHPVISKMFPLNLDLKILENYQEFKLVIDHPTLFRPTQFRLLYRDVCLEVLQYLNENPQCLKGYNFIVSHHQPVVTFGPTLCNLITYKSLKTKPKEIIKYCFDNNLMRSFASIPNTRDRRGVHGTLAPFVLRQDITSLFYIIQFENQVKHRTLSVPAVFELIGFSVTNIIEILIKNNLLEQSSDWIYSSLALYGLEIIKLLFYHAPKYLESQKDKYSTLQSRFKDEISKYLCSTNNEISILSFKLLKKNTYNVKENVKQHFLL
ncbi:hypothetical protein DLAC_01000 [Tieghemostelium lacteum]|uniref:Ankyrin repeat-containing protein n=1 Tax=Tieghemostelium lacteum TaxID=361077 RepID=A0A152A7S7_TIELA|nr:hypothetical protein DLAC_01000 [Tieghemostelium lacteum]|eukprot:KYR02185.1 hypothetical protein DLAC_01000 [Tieghemostelium lacteum]